MPTKILLPSGCQELSLFFLKPPEAVPNSPSSVNKLDKQCQIVFWWIQICYIQIASFLSTQVYQGHFILYLFIKHPLLVTREEYRQGNREAFQQRGKKKPKTQQSILSTRGSLLCLSIPRVKTWGQKPCFLPLVVFLKPGEHKGCRKRSRGERFIGSHPALRQAKHAREGGRQEARGHG